MSGFDDWIGRGMTVSDTLEPARSNALDVALGGKGGLGIGDPLPLLHHWLYFWDVHAPAGLGHDGHPARGHFLPDVPLPRRMWAGGRLSFLQPLRLGATVAKTSTIAAISEKSGKSGRLVFVTVRHELVGETGPAIREEQDLVYRAAASAGTGAAALPVPAPRPDAPWVDSLVPDPVLLFRYSALTMNGHRIHYDRPYAMAEEGYPALVVQGPLQATLLMRLAASRLDAPITGFSFRGIAPAYEGLPLHLCGRADGTGAEVWSQQGAAPAMSARAETAAP